MCCFAHISGLRLVHVHVRNRRGLWSFCACHGTTPHVFFLQKGVKITPLTYWTLLHMSQCFRLAVIEWNVQTSINCCNWLFIHFWVYVARVVWNCHRFRLELCLNCDVGYTREAKFKILNSLDNKSISHMNFRVTLIRNCINIHINFCLITIFFV